VPWRRDRQTSWAHTVCCPQPVMYDHTARAPASAGSW
jgi:hypothetical protein